MRKVILTLLFTMSFQVFAGSQATFLVEGMTCASCAGSIERSVRKLPNVGKVDISVKAGKVTVIGKEGKNLELNQIKEAIEQAGYKVKAIEKAK